MKQVISTQVLDRKAGPTVWLDGNKLDRLNWSKGDTVDIQPINDKTLKLSRRTTPLPRSTPTTHNISGRKQMNREGHKALIELPIKKANLDWSIGVKLEVIVTSDYILIKINDYMEKRRDRINKFKQCIQENQATLLDIPVDDVPNQPHSNETLSADLCKLKFNKSAEKSAKFFNALLTIEKSNPFIIEISNFDSMQNTPKEGLLSVLKNLDYRISSVKECETIFAISQGIDIDFEHAYISLGSPNKMDLLEVVHFQNISTFNPVFANPLGNPVKRLEQLSNDVASKQITHSSLFHGGGSLDSVFKQYISDQDFDHNLALVSEINDQYLQHSFEVNRESFKPNTTILNGDISHYDSEQYNHIRSSLMSLGIVCKGASNAGKASLKLKNAEAHPTAGFLFYDSLKFIAFIDPSITVIENTNTYKNTASYSAIKEVLKALKYSFVDGILNSNDFGTIETRKRLFLVACDDQDALQNENIFAQKHHVFGPKRTVNMVVDHTISNDDPTYKDYSALKEKEIRDIAEGKGFRRSLYSGSESSVCLFRQTYIKAGSCDPYYQHPTNPELSRLFSIQEHAQLAGYPLDFINKANCKGRDIIHSILGQGWSWHTASHIIKRVFSIATNAKITPIKITTQLDQQVSATNETPYEQYAFNF